MTKSQDELREFVRFADGKLRNGAAHTLLELACEWESQRRDGHPSSEPAPIDMDLESLRQLARHFPEAPEDGQLEQALARRGGATTAEMLGQAMLAAARAQCA
jgi:hypothetical protein